MVRDSGDEVQGVSNDDILMIIDYWRLVIKNDKF